MTFVLDASVVLAWCFDDETDPVADAVLDRLAHETAIAPAHWPLEVANGLRTAERRGRLTGSDVSRLRSLLAALPVDVIQVEPSVALGSVLETARSHGLTTYDAVYLDLAATRGLALATVDEQLRAACDVAGVALAG
jgi:predicted nucleic acid-binding protein